MRLRFVWVGKTRKRPLKVLIDEYLERLKPFARVEVVEVRDRDDVGGDAHRVLEKEGEEILSRILKDPFVIILDERGGEFDSAGMARMIEKHRIAGTKQLTFVIGGHNGLADAVKERADLKLALSRMTLTHEFARLMAAEQIYRAFTIIYDLPYQK